jgi:hypothetical protein
MNENIQVLICQVTQFSTMVTILNNSLTEMVIHIKLFLYIHRIVQLPSILEISIPYQITSHPHLPLAQATLIYFHALCKWNIQYVVFCICLHSPSLMFSRLIHVVACTSTSFLLLVKIVFHSFYVICFIYHLSVGRYSCLFPLFGSYK